MKVQLVIWIIHFASDFLHECFDEFQTLVKKQNHKFFEWIRISLRGRKLIFWKNTKKLVMLLYVHFMKEF